MAGERQLAAAFDGTRARRGRDFRPRPSRRESRTRRVALPSARISSTEAPSCSAHTSRTRSGPVQRTHHRRFAAACTFHSRAGLRNRPLSVRSPFPRLRRWSSCKSRRRRCSGRLPRTSGRPCTFHTRARRCIHLPLSRNSRWQPRTYREHSRLRRGLGRILPGSPSCCIPLQPPQPAPARESTGSYPWCVSERSPRRELRIRHGPRSAANHSRFAGPWRGGRGTHV
jgi:hypothetical protein